MSCPYAVRLVDPPVWMGPHLHWVDSVDQALRFPSIAAALRYAIEERGFAREDILVVATSILPLPGGMPGRELVPRTPAG